MSILLFCFYLNGPSLKICSEQPNMPMMLKRKKKPNTTLPDLFPNFGREENPHTAHHITARSRPQGLPPAPGFFPDSAMAPLLLAVLAFHLAAAAGVSAAPSAADAGAFDPSRVVQLSWRPR